MRREVPVERVRSWLQAGQGAYQDVLTADQVRTELVGAGIGPSRMSPAESSQLLCAWVAYALQSLADEFVAAEESTGPPPAPGFVSQITSEQIRVLAADVPGWIARTRRAATDPGYDVAAEIPLPAALPPWVRAEPCPFSHLVAMRRAAAIMFERLELAMADFERTAADDAGGAPHQLRGLLVEVQTVLGAVPDQPLLEHRLAREHESIEATLRDVVGRCFSLGQMLSRPRLLRGPSRPPNWSPPPQQSPDWTAAAPDRPPPDQWYGYGPTHHGPHSGHH